MKYFITHIVRVRSNRRRCIARPEEDVQLLSAFIAHNSHGWRHPEYHQRHHHYHRRCTHVYTDSRNSGHILENLRQRALVPYPSNVWDRELWLWRNSNWSLSQHSCFGIPSIYLNYLSGRDNSTTTIAVMTDTSNLLLPIIDHHHASTYSSM